MDNWLAKLAAEQPTTEENLQQALSELSIEELRELQDEPATPNLDSFQEKLAEADQMGRELAHEHGVGLAAQAEQRAMQNHAVMRAVQELPDDEAVKLAFVMENGDEEQVKEAFAGLIAKIAPAAKRLISSGGMKKAVTSAGRFAKKNPNAAMAVGSGVAGGVANKAQGGSFTRGAVTGAGLGYGGGKLMGVTGKGLSGRIGKAYGKGLSWAKTASPLSDAVRSQVALDLEKVAYHEDAKNEWIEQFEGTPLLQQALEMAQEELQAEMQEIADRRDRRVEDAERDRTWETKDMLRAKKRLLELQLVAQRNGLSEPDGDELGGDATTADHSEPDGDESEEGPHTEETAMNEEAQEQVKEAYARALGFEKTAFIPQGLIGYFSAGDKEEREASPRSGFWRGAGGGILGGALGGAAGSVIGHAVKNPAMAGLGGLGGSVYGAYLGGKSARPTDKEMRMHRAAQKAKLREKAKQASLRPR